MSLLMVELEKQINQLQSSCEWWFKLYDNLRRPVQQFILLLDSGKIDIAEKDRLLNEIRQQLKEIK